MTHRRKITPLVVVLSFVGFSAIGGDFFCIFFCYGLVTRRQTDDLSRRGRSCCLNRIKVLMKMVMSESDRYHTHTTLGQRTGAQDSTSSSISKDQPGKFPFTSTSTIPKASNQPTALSNQRQDTADNDGDDAMSRHVERKWGTRPNLQNFPLANFPIGSVEDPTVPPILEIPQFLSSSECQLIREWAQEAIENGAPECDEYLNYRVNQEINQVGMTSEGKALIEEHLGGQQQQQPYHSLDSSTSSSSKNSPTQPPPPALTAENRGGFRIRLDNRLVERIVKNRLLDVLNMPSRELVFEEGAWIRPTPRTLVVRDQTVVYYAGGDGVPPHVDGKDGTLLLYLATVQENVGGRTVFPEDGFAQTPKEGTALLYRSKTELLHYSEAMKDGEEKWIMQLLLDYNHSFHPGDTVVDFSTGQSYVWDGTK
jgi:hypothetical protein